jgi:hypothetical protein
MNFIDSIEYYWMRSLDLEMGAILYFILRFPKLEKFNFLVKIVENLADIYGALLDELGIEILLNGKAIPMVKALGLPAAKEGDEE